MVYDATEPKNTTKIRNLGVVIRPNFEAIEIADSSFKPYATNFANRTPLAVPNDPAAIVNSYILYNKEDSHGKQQLYAIDSASKITQLTNTLVPLAASTGYTWLPGGILLQWGKETVPAGESNAITFLVAFQHAPYDIQLTAIRSVGSTTNSMYLSSTHPATNTDFRIINTASSAHDCFWLAIGKQS